MSIVETEKNRDEENVKSGEYSRRIYESRVCSICDLRFVVDPIAKLVEYGVTPFTLLQSLDPAIIYQTQRTRNENFRKDLN